jgi:hypothetical protein
VPVKNGAGIAVEENVHLPVLIAGTRLDEIRERIKTPESEG